VVPVGSEASVQPSSLTTNSVLPFLNVQMACVHGPVTLRDFVPEVASMSGLSVMKRGLFQCNGPQKLDRSLIGG
jgi:hypothetical protein